MYDDRDKREEKDEDEIYYGRPQKPNENSTIERIDGRDVIRSEYEESVEREDIGEDIKNEEVKNEEAKERRSSKKRKKKSGSKFAYFFSALLGALLGGLLVIYVGPKILPSDVVKEERNQPLQIKSSDDMNVAAAVAKKGMPSVVGITTTEVQQFFYSLREVEGVGSGLIIDPDGYILTNSHVVGDGNAKDIKVLFEDGEQIEGKVLWNDRSLDLAVVKVDKKGLPAAELGNSDDIQVGEIAVAIGNPLGLEFQRSVTSGIISGLNRTVEGDGLVMDDLIQTDASINPGNSGGPLLNAKGQVIGINTVKVKSAEGLGFSIPINEAKEIIKDVVETGDHSAVSLGISLWDVEEYEAVTGANLGIDGGVVVIEVVKDSAAAKAKMAIGDIIVAIDGEKISSKEILKKRLYKYKPGDKAVFEIIRSGEIEKLEVTFLSK